MPDHYETLGLARDASQDDIKAAFRRAASQAHPDKGGDVERMAAINRAYETLGDPQRRAEYDSTGGDNAADRLETEARQRLVSLFDAVLAGVEDDLMGAARKVLTATQVQVEAEHSACGRRAARLRKHRDRVLRKSDGENLFTGLVDSQLQQIDAQLAQLQHGRAVFARVNELLEEYEMAPGAVVVATQTAYTAGYHNTFNFLGDQP